MRGLLWIKLMLVVVLLLTVSGSAMAVTDQSAREGVEAVRCTLWYGVPVGLLGLVVALILMFVRNVPLRVAGIVALTSVMLPIYGLFLDVMGWDTKGAQLALDMMLIVTVCGVLAYRYFNLPPRDGESDDEEERQSRWYRLWTVPMCLLASLAGPAYFNIMMIWMASGTCDAV